MTRVQAFKIFLKHFSEEKLPITFSDEGQVYFSSKNTPLDVDSVRRFLMPDEEQDEEDMTEYIACVQIPDTKDYHAVVYWKGGLLSYEYILATYSKNGVQIDKKVIAGIRSDGQDVQRSVATIDEDLSIQVVVGAISGSEQFYDPQNSKQASMEMLSDGKIVLLAAEDAVQL